MINLKYDKEKYEVAEVLKPGNLPKIHPVWYIILLVVALYFLVRFPIYVIIIVGYVMLHELIHWMTRFCLTGEHAKFGIVGINPCVYSNGFTSRNNAIIQLSAPLILFTLVIIVGLIFRVIAWESWGTLLFLLNLAGSMTDIQMIRWYLQYPDTVLCGDDGENNYILRLKNTIKIRIGRFGKSLSEIRI